MKLIRAVLFGVLAVGTMLPMSASAQAEVDQVIVVPYSQKNPALPHPAHEDAHITLKAIVRNASCATYQVWWDTNRNDNYDDDYRRDVNREGTTGSVRDIGRTFKVPAVNADQSFNINVRVRNTCNGNDKFGTMRIFVYDFRPTNDPRLWTNDQLEIMASMMVQESLWYTHRTIGAFSGRDTSVIKAASGYEPATNVQMWQFTVNGHLPAYPPGSINWHGIAPPNGWEVENDRRWDADPYAETTVRMLNRLTQNYNRFAIPGVEESNQHGYTWNGNAYVAETQNRLANTTDGHGISSYRWTARSANGNYTYTMGMTLGALATVLPSLAGTPLQNGPTGWLWERYLQEVTDFMGYGQIDGGCGKGGWYYTAYNSSGSCTTGDFSTTQWAFVGFEAAAVVGEPYGVFVNNHHKYRVASMILANQRGDGGAAYDNQKRYAGLDSNFKMTGGAILAHRMIGTHNMPADGRVPFPNEQPTIPIEWVNTCPNCGYAANQALTRAVLVDSYNRHVGFAAAQFNLIAGRGSIGWQNGQWQAGDYLCGNTNAIYNAGRCGDTYTMYSHQKGYATGLPELQRIGNNDWKRMYNTYYIRAQDRSMNVANPMTGYSLFGRVIDQYCDRSSTTCNYGSGYLGSGMAGLAATPTVFNPKPVALAIAQPATVVEGCSGGNAGRVTFDHSTSFHPDAGARIVAYQWDVNTVGGLWWDVAGAPVDFETADGNQSFEHRYLTRGNFTATLRVVDSNGQSKTTTVTVQVDAANNVAPAAAHGGPYTMEVGQNLQLDGNATDQNAGCGDNLTVTWDLDNDGAFDDGNGPTPNAPWAVFQNLPQGAANPTTIRIKVRDASGAEVIEQTTVTIYPREPVAAGRANPNPASCAQEITFDASASNHPNPDRTISQYAWDIDGDGNTDGGGQIFRFSYAQFDTYDVTLTVTDDLGRTDTDAFQVAVTEGNQAPIARVASNEIVVLEDEPLVLDGRPSTDPDVACGDSIVEYAWDLNGNGSWADPVDVQGANPTVAWATVAANLQWPANRNTGLPTNTITLRVTDEFGATATIPVIVRVYQANPVAEVVQVPDPATINIVTGFSRATLDGRQSFSTVPGVNIARFDWDLDDDGAFETANRATVDKTHIFNPIPLPPLEIPAVFVRLQVTDDNGRTNIVRYQVQYDIPPTAPTADADPTDPPERGYDMLAGEDLVVDATQSFDPDEAEAGDFLRFYRWDLNYDGNNFVADVTREDVDGNGGAAVKRTTVTWAELNAAGINGPGEYTVRLQVQDSTGLTNTDDATLRVYAAAPVALADVNPNPASCGGRVSFDGSASNHPHPTIDIAGYSWNFGDGTPAAAGAQVQHTYDAFTFGAANSVVLTVEDTRGETSQLTIDVPVTEGNRAPGANAGGFRDGNGQVVGPYAIAIAEGVALSAAGSVDPDAACGDSIQTYQWDLRNDGTIDANGAQVNLTWAQLNAAGINNPGSYDVRLRVTDRFGATGDGLATLIVANLPVAVATANPNRAGCEQQVTFSGAGSTFDGPAAQDFGIVAYDWDLDGDGQFDDASGASVTRPVVAQPDAQGNIRVTANLRVTDGAGRTSTAATVVNIDVQNGAPVANAGGPYTTGPVNVGFANVTLDGRGSIDPNAPCDSVAVYKWDTDNDGLYGVDDNPDDLVGATIVYNNPAWQVNTVQTVRLVACDVAGACSLPGEASIEVQAQAPPAGEVISPRADDGICLGAGNFDVVIDVSDPAGDVVTATVMAGGVQVGQQNVDTPDDGSSSRITIQVNAGLVPEGRHEIVINLLDAGGAPSQATSGGRLTFDRTAPQVVIGNELGDGVCYNPNAVPNPTITVTDNLDQGPATNQAAIEDGCGRTLRVTATDACGNTGSAERAYLTAQAIEADIQGVAEGELVASAQITWDIIGPAECASAVSAQYVRNGGAAVNYPENQEINQAGNYALTVSVSNCLAVARQQIRNFSVNAPPLAVAIPPGHANGDPNLPNAYIAIEGGGLQLDGSASTSPEAGDSIALYEWDLDGDGVFEVQGEVVAFDTSEDGVFNGALKVTDSLGASNTALLRVTVLDVDPVADAAGPYVVDQGTPLQVDGRASQPGSAADPISNYSWNFGDGTPAQQGGALNQPSHTYTANGTYTIRLTITDEDSSSFVDVRVTVRDVSPIIDGINAPADPYEISPMHFSIDARPGTLSDPITRIEWDMDGDGVAEYAGVGLTEIDHQFDAAGRYNVTVTVRDGDSDSVDGILVDVREVTLAEIIAWTDEKVTADLAGGQLPLLAGFQLGGIQANLDQARWGEEHGERGVTFMALEAAVRQLVAAQGQGADYSWELWALSRQLKREMDRLKDARLNNDGAGANDPSMLAAQDHLDGVDAVFGDPNFRDDLNSNDQVMVANDLFFEARESYYWLQDATDACNDYNDFALPNSNDPLEVGAAGNLVNTNDLRPALLALKAELEAYVALGGALDPAPGLADVNNVLVQLDGILALQDINLGPLCPEGMRCITDREALDMELQATELVRSLEVAGNNGAWVRQWQSCMVLAIKFRIELSIRRVEFVCGRNAAITRRARDVQNVGLNFVSQDRDAEALGYYGHVDQQCAMIEIYDSCLVSAFPDDNLPYDGPVACADQ